ncbi:MAG: hypothetical protein P8M72_02865 [Gammaproteobacteria bacterium]|nr:hypothetical protein [Gammaproteobacteria bacterium]
MDNLAPLPSCDRDMDNWINDPEKVERVKELYPPSKVMHEKFKTTAGFS